MSRECVEIVRGWFARLDAGDPAPDLCDPAIEIRNWDESPVPGPYRGHDGLHRWWKDLHDPDISVEIRFFELERIVEVDESRAVTIQRASGRGRTSGLEVVQSWGSIIGTRDGKIASATGYPTPEEALAAAGMPEG